MKRLFGSIEDKHGVHDPAYEPPVEQAASIIEHKDGFGALEIIGCLLIPIGGVVFAIMRFADEEVGAGLACLLMGALSAAGWFALLLLLH